MSSTILNSSDWERMKRSVLPGSVNDSKSRRKEELKKLSTEKYQNWPNTLDALRQKKLNFVEEKAHAEELARQEVDRQEAELRRKQRLESIKRANDLMYDQTDKMKGLRGAKLYAEVVLTRQQQVQEKGDRKAVEKDFNRTFHENILEVVRKGNAEDEVKANLLAAKIDSIKVQRREQVEEVLKKRADEAAEAFAIGEALKKRAQEQLAEEMQRQADKQTRIAEANLVTLKANERAKIVQLELAAKEKEAALAREGEKEEIEGRVKALKALEKRRFEKKQETRQKMIDRAVELLANQKKGVEAIELKQGEEIRAKEDKAIADKAAKREAERVAIKESRAEMLTAKKEKLERQWDEEERLVLAQREQSAREEEAEQNKKAREHENIRRLKAIQYSDAAKKQKKLIEERVISIQQAKLLQDVGTQDDDKFAAICKAEILRFTKEGKPTYTLMKAMEQTAVPLLAAKLDPTKRGKGLERT